MTQKLLKDFFGNYWSAAVFLFAVIILSIIYPVWLQTDGNSLLSWDSSGYYFYLPAFFIYNDPLHLSFAPYILETYQPTSYFYQAYKLPDGNWVMSYTMGVAMLQMPFFIIAHLIALLAGFPTDGFSVPYQFMMYVSGVFYSFLGIIFLSKAIRTFVSSTIANWVICLLVLGTHWLYYATIENGMTQQQLQETEQRLQKKQADIQKLQTQLTTDLQTQLTQFNQQLKDSLDSFLEDYNASNKYTMILSIVEGGQVLYSEPQYDITADAIEWMNERIRP
jgi:ABC-type multidrug transport system fused ATPase/permease subunit